MKLDPQTGGGIYGYNLDPGLAPLGQVIAVCLDIRDQFGVDRKKFQSQEIEKQDITRFLFGFQGPDGRPYLVQTFEFKISGNSGSNLVDFLKAWTSRDPYGFDYLELKGSGAMLTIGQKQSTRTPGKWYNEISAFSPVYPTLQAQIPNPAIFTELLRKALAPPDMTQRPPQGQPAHPPGPPPPPPPAAPGYQQLPPPPVPGYTPPPPPPEQMVTALQGGQAVTLPRSVVADGIRIGSITHVLNPATNQWQEVKAAAPILPNAPLPPPPAANPGWQQPPPAPPQYQQQPPPPPVYTPPPPPVPPPAHTPPLDDIPF